MVKSPTEKDVHIMVTPTRTAARTTGAPVHVQQPVAPRRSSFAGFALNGLRLAVGVEFLWAFFDKLFGFGYATPSAKAWISGGSPTNGFLTHANAGPLKGFFHSLAGTTGIDTLFMAALLGVGLAMVLGVALRVAAASGTLLLSMMWLAAWPLAKIAEGKPTGSNNPIVDSHVISAFALLVVAGLAVGSAGPLGRIWARLPLVRDHSWMR